MDAGAGAGMQTRTDERDPGARVLVVEDDADVARPLVLTLREEGYAVTWAASGWQALELLRESTEALDEPIRLVLLDLGLPDVDGLDVCRQARQHRLRRRDPDHLRAGQRAGPRGRARPGRGRLRREAVPAGRGAGAGPGAAAADRPAGHRGRHAVARLDDRGLGGGARRRRGRGRRGVGRAVGGGGPRRQLGRGRRRRRRPVAPRVRRAPAARRPARLRGHPGGPDRAGLASRRAGLRQDPRRHRRPAARRVSPPRTRRPGWSRSAAWATASSRPASPPRSHWRVSVGT